MEKTRTRECCWFTYFWCSSNSSSSFCRRTLNWIYSRCPCHAMYWLSTLRRWQWEKRYSRLFVPRKLLRVCREANVKYLLCWLCVVWWAKGRQHRRGTEDLFDIRLHSMWDMDQPQIDWLDGWWGTRQVVRGEHEINIGEETERGGCLKCSQDNTVDYCSYRWE